VKISTLLKLCLVGALMWAGLFAVASHAQITSAASAIAAVAAQADAGAPSGDVMAPLNNPVASAVAPPANGPVPAPVTQFPHLAVAAGVILAVLGLVKKLLQTAALSSVWGKLNPVVRVGILAALAAAMASIDAFQGGASWATALSAGFFGLVGVIQHGTDLAPAEPPAAA